MNKIKTLAIVGLLLMTTACAEDKYVSVRHPEGEAVTEVTDSDLEEVDSQDTSEPIDQDANNDMSDENSQQAESNVNNADNADNQAGTGQDTDDKENEDQSDGVISVSYTHLTLPTKA